MRYYFKDEFIIQNTLSKGNNVCALEYNSQQLAIFSPPTT